MQATQEIMSTAGNDGVNVIVLTAYNDVEQKYHAYRAGAAAYFPKDVRPARLLAAIRAVADDRCVLDDRVVSKAELFRWLVDEHREMVPFGEAPEETLSPLSPREMEILGYVTRGASNKEIAHLLGISRQTVKNHMSSILRKLNVEDRTQAAVLALRRGWVRLEDTRHWAQDTETGNV
ncbi:MAG: response regulator transcription factor [Caldilineaceae bacterium]|nr:response regulator transcription factor [Caldilineaceae bacterium]